jgi:hypothetical protein
MTTPHRPTTTSTTTTHTKAPPKLIKKRTEYNVQLAQTRARHVDLQKIAIMQSKFNASMIAASLDDEDRA